MGLSENRVMHKSTIDSLPGQSDSMARLNNISLYLNQGLARLAGCSLLLLVLVVVVNATMRVFGAPFSGATEVAGWLTAVSIAFGLGYTQINRGYVEIDALVDRLPKAGQRIIKRIMLFINMVFCSLAAWQIAVYGLKVMKNGNLSETMQIPFYPLIFLLSLGFAGLTLALLVDLLKEYNGGAGK